MPTVSTEQDAPHLRRALELAEGGRGRVSPNPLVGAVLVRDGPDRSARASTPSSAASTPSGRRSKRLATAARTRRDRPSTSPSSPAPTPAASRPAPRRSSRRASPASSTRPRTRPRRPPAAGPGCSATAGWRSSWPAVPRPAAARLLNQPFRKRARTGRPLVTYKAAMSLDGRVASPTGDSRWISSVESRELVHRWRVRVRRRRGRHRHRPRRRPAAHRQARRAPRDSPAGSSSTRTPGCPSTPRWSARSTRRR